MSRPEPTRYSASPRVGSQQRRALSGAMRDDSGAEASFRSADIPRLREAMKGVIEWTEEVVSGLCPLQWQVIGYAQNPDGSPDFSRPYHSTPNPNEYISRVLSTYSEVTLQCLLNSIEGSGSPLQENLVSLPRAAPRMPDEAMMSEQGLLPFPMDPRLGPPGMPTHASMPQGGSFLPPGHPMAMPPDVFRGKGDSGDPLQAAAHNPHQSPMQSQNPMGPPASQLLLAMMLRMADMGGIAMSSHAASLPTQGVCGKSEMQQPPSTPSYDDNNRESEVAYVLATPYKAKRTGERLGFPAYSESKEILGFYFVDQFLPISHCRDEFGPPEIKQATQTLNEALKAKSDSVYRLKDWGSIANLIADALVYDWNKDIGGSNSEGSGD